MSASSSRSFKIAVLISGGGTTLRNLIDRISDGRLHVAVGLVISSNPQAGGLKFAREADIPCLVIEQKNFPDQDTFSREIFGHCRRHGRRPGRNGRVSQAIDDRRGFQRSRDQYSPALIPAFCGKGYYGHRVHEAVLEYGAKLSGCTVHFADNQYDHGPVILQKAVPVMDDDTPDTLAARVFRSRVRGLSRGRRTDRPGPSPHRISGACQFYRREEPLRTAVNDHKKTNRLSSIAPVMLPRTSPLAPRR